MESMGYDFTTSGGSENGARRALLVMVFPRGIAKQKGIDYLVIKTP